MAAITLPTSVKPTTTTKFAPIGLLGATIVVGNSLYQDTVDQKWKLCDSNSTLAVGTLKGIAFTAGVDGDYGLIAISGSVIMVGSTLVVGDTYGVGQTPGSVVPMADLVTGDYVNIVGVASTATKMDLGIKATGIIKA
jgi:tellurite resistance protein TehA-like permease